MEKPKITASILFNIVFRKLLNFLGFAGAIFILYGVFNMYREEFRVLEALADWFSSFLTLFGAFLTAISIYLKGNPKPPEYFSKFVSAPITIVCSVTAIFYLLLKGSLSPHIINGFALLAIAGGLFRIQAKPDLD